MIVRVEREFMSLAAEEGFILGVDYTVVECYVCSWSSEFRFDGRAGYFDCTWFNKSYGECPDELIRYNRSS